MSAAVPPIEAIEGANENITPNQNLTSNPTRNAGRGRGRGGRGERGGYQGRHGRGSGRYNRTNTSSVLSFKGEVEGVAATLGTTAERRKIKDEFQIFSEKLKQYLLREFKNPEDIIVLVRDIKDPMTVHDATKPLALSEEDARDAV